MLAPSPTQRAWFLQSLQQWFTANQRILPWRTSRNPYHIWLSEIILQQTRVQQGWSYYERFVAAYPTIKHLAAASQTEVLRLWQGLGYYTRARNLHICAQQIMSAHGGRFPTNFEALRQLPGIGVYTAAAIASIAFDEAVPVVDGNVYRVLSRVWGLSNPIDTSQGQRSFRQLAEKLVPQEAPGQHNEAIMDFGALQCTPKAPRCVSCPFRTGCVAYIERLQHILPVKVRRVKIRTRYFHYLFLHHHDALYWRVRPAGDIWQGLHEAYLVEQPLCGWQWLVDELAEQLRAWYLPVCTSKTVYSHVLTHQRLQVRVFHIQLNDAFIAQCGPLLHAKGLHAYTPDAIKGLPKSVLMSKLLQEEGFTMPVKGD